MNIFENIKREHISEALNKIDFEGIPPRLMGRDYAVIINDKEYPFKYLVSIAYKIATGEHLDVSDFKSSESLRNKFQELYNLQIKNINSMDLKDYISVYKKLIRSEDYNELYKWEVVKKFQDNWDLNSPDFAGMLSRSLQPENCNLWAGYQYYPRKMLTGLAAKFPDDFRTMFAELFDENNDLIQRIVNFQNSVEVFLSQAEPGRELNTYQDERAVMVYLTLKYPDTYYLYKNKMYNDFCSVTGVKEKPGRLTKNNKDILFEFMNFCNQVKMELLKDEELLQMHKDRLDYNIHYKEREFNLLTQDFIYSISRNPTRELSGESPDSLEETEIKSYNMKTDNLNVILYGPPGTGKTYHTVDMAVELINGTSSNDHEENKKIFDKLRKNGQIDFVTFHQSYSYEDFVEGIKPKIVDSEQAEEDVSTNKNNGDIQYERTRGIFYDINSLALEAYKSFREIDGFGEYKLTDIDLKDAEFFKMSLGNTQIGEDEAIYQYCINNNCIGLGWGGNIDYTEANSEKEIKDLMLKEITEVRRYELFAVKCFKTWMRKGDIVFISNGNYACRAIGKIESDYYYDADNEARYRHFRKVKWILKNVNIPVNEVYGKIFSQQTIYQMYTHLVKKEFFTDLKSSAKKDPDKYVLVIDEINRGNISNIFGELITLIEKDKRFGLSGVLTAKLPYSKEDFSVAPNLYIIGTMNTADRSVEALDTALRRRFSFVEMSPKYDVISNPADFKVDLQKMLIAINNRLEILLDKDHCIGHSYFIDIHKSSDPELELKKVFKNSIIPLLQEYFYGSPEKIRYVLGVDFVKSKFSSSSDNIWIKGNIPEELEQKSVYEILNPMTFADLKPFKSIYEPDKSI